jgi:hypothetical protein
MSEDTMAKLRFDMTEQQKIKAEERRNKREDYQVKIYRDSFKTII